MPRKAISLDPFAPVHKILLQTPDGRPSSRYAVTLDDYGEEVEVGIVSDQYALVPNHVVHDVALDVLDQAGMAFEDAGAIFDGKKYRNRWVLPDLTVEPQPGDFVNLCFDIQNSYDGSTQVGIAFNARRLVCSNGMQVDFLLGGMRLRHIGRDNFADELQIAAQRVHRLAEQIEPLSRRLQILVNHRVDRTDIQRLFRDTKLSKGLRADIFDEITGDNGWDLYNACTDVLTRMDSHHGDQLNRQVSRYMLAA